MLMRTNRGETAVHVSLCPVDLVQCVYALRQWVGVRVSLCLFYKIIISVNPNSVLTFYVYVSDQTVSLIFFNDLWRLGVITRRKYILPA